MKISNYLILITITLIIAKLMGLTISWVWVFSILWIPILLFIGLILLIYLFIAVTILIDSI